VKQTFRAVDAAIAGAADLGALSQLLAALLAREAIVRGLMDDGSASSSSSAVTGGTHETKNVSPIPR